MRIVDLTAGNRAIWFNKDYPGVAYCDIRPEVEPKFLVNATNTHLAEDHFDLVVFDPPHANFGKNGNMTKIYGHWTAKQIKELISGAAKEAHRITRRNALMAFKWNDHDLKLEKALKLMSEYWEPLFGHVVSARKATRASTTFWVQLKRIDEKTAGTIPYDIHDDIY